MKLRECNLSKQEKSAYQEKLTKFQKKNETYIQDLEKSIENLKNIGVDINDISVKEDENGNLQFNFEPSHFSDEKPNKQIPVPLNSNEDNIDFWTEFLQCEKIPIKSTVYSPSCKDAINGNIETKGKEVCALWLIGKVHGKPYEFSLSVVKSSKHNDNLSDFKISMSVLVSKEQNLWVEIARFDSKGPIHFNYSDENGNLYDEVDDLELSSPPHLHINSDKAEVITHLPYAHQTFGIISNKIKNNDKTAFHDAVLEMMQFCHINQNIINPNIPDDFNFHIGYNIFNEDIIIVPNNSYEIDLLIDSFKDINNTNNKGVIIE